MHVGLWKQSLKINILLTDVCDTAVFIKADRWERSIRRYCFSCSKVPCRSAHSVCYYTEKYHLTQGQKHWNSCGKWASLLWLVSSGSAHHSASVDFWNSNKAFLLNQKRIWPQSAGWLIQTDFQQVSWGFHDILTFPWDDFRYHTDTGAAPLHNRAVIFLPTVKHTWNSLKVTSVTISHCGEVWWIRLRRLWSTNKQIIIHFKPVTDIQHFPHVQTFVHFEEKVFVSDSVMSSGSSWTEIQSAAFDQVDCQQVSKQVKNSQSCPESAWVKTTKAGVCAKWNKKSNVINLSEKMKLGVMLRYKKAFKRTFEKIWYPLKEFNKTSICNIHRV